MNPSARASARGLAALAALGLAAGLVVAWLTLASDHLDEPGVDAVLALLVGWSFVGTGLFAWWRRPGNHTGLLMVAIGFAWFATSLSASDDDLLFTIGIALDGLFLAMLGHLLIAFPSGRLETRAERLVVLAIYCVATVLQVPGLLFEESGEPSNLLMVEPNQGLSDLLDRLQYLAAVVMTVVGFVVIYRRRATVPAARRPVLSPVLWTGGATLAAFVVAQGLDAVGSPEPWLERLALLLFATVPFGFLACLLRTRLAHGAAVSELVARLGDAPGEKELRAALAEGLGRCGRAARLLAARVGALRRCRRSPLHAPRAGLDRGRAAGTTGRRDCPRSGTRRGAGSHSHGRRCRRPGTREPAPVGRAAGPHRGPARLAVTARRSRRCGAAAARARPPRRRPVAAGRARAEAPAGAPPRRRAPRAGDDPRRIQRRAQGEPRRVARARARHPPCGADRPRLTPRARDAGKPRTRPRRAVRRRRRPAGGARHGRLLRRLGGAHQRGEVRGGRERRGDARA